jgi:hypothetical protein
MGHDRLLLNPFLFTELCHSFKNLTLNNTYDRYGVINDLIYISIHRYIWFRTKSFSGIATISQVGHLCEVT